MLYKHQYNGYQLQYIIPPENVWAQFVVVDPSLSSSDVEKSAFTWPPNVMASGNVDLLLSYPVSDSL